MRIVVDPKEQYNFARFLEEFTRTLSQRNEKTLDASKELGALWADERYREFSKELAEASQTIRDFTASSRRFVEYLNKKAAAGNLYLRR